MQVVKAELIPSEEKGVSIEAEVENTGDVDTREVVQVYLKNLDSRYGVRNPQLAAFSGIFLKAGEKKKIPPTLSEKSFTVVDEEGKRRENGKNFALFVSCSQPDERSAELTGVQSLKILYQREE